ncbi:TIR domain-containing adapter molecule 2 [Platysternon megacephalum]|uniref:TIR domain-containing adapter molecule 2 n=1 Tax=Platysternon megacephalum TaxID=55544 RepID=A0A4D9EQQ1_9SAUR|nr:TIR domain-containing adapter molecule 2 [Platysternon megacephalum]
MPPRGDVREQNGAEKGMPKCIKHAPIALFSFEAGFIMVQHHYIAFFIQKMDRKGTD